MREILRKENPICKDFFRLNHCEVTAPPLKYKECPYFQISNEYTKIDKQGRRVNHNKISELKKYIKAEYKHNKF